VRARARRPGRAAERVGRPRARRRRPPHRRRGRPPRPVARRPGIDHPDRRASAPPPPGPAPPPPPHPPHLQPSRPATPPPARQPPGDPEWRSDPFRFTRRGDRYLGRGTTDDKGPALTALFGAKYAVDHDVPLNVHLLWELEEEIGSPHFERTIRRHRRTLATDAVVVSDTIWVSRSQPACPAAPRGLPRLPPT